MACCYAITDPVDVGMARALMYRVWVELAALQGARRQAREARALRACREAREAFEEASKGLFEEALARAQEASAEVLGRLAARYPYVDFLLGAPLVRPSQLAVVAHPPDLTLRRCPDDVRVDASAYIQYDFAPSTVRKRRGGEGRHAPVHSKFFSELNWYPLYTGSVRLPPRLREEYEREYERELARRGSRRAARVLAVKKVLRIVVGCAWLVAVLWGLDAGRIGADDVVLPRLLQWRPEAARRLVQPADVAGEEWRDYTWTRLVDLVSPRS